MTIGWIAPRTAAAALLLAGLGAASAPAMAQDEARLRKVEAEVKALQRAVFPNGDTRFFTPEVTPGTPQPVTPVATPSATPLTDVLARLDALEGQVQRLTASGEEKDHQLAELQRKFDEAKAALDASSTSETPVASAQPSGPIPLPSLSGGGSGSRTVPAPASATNTTRPTPTPAAALTTPRPATPAPAASGPTAARLAAVRAVAKPQTADAGDDEYSYGFRLYDAGFLPEARQQLSLFLQKYPKHDRVSYARNLLGRTFLDEGQPREAAKYFFENYQTGKQGARAPDSLLYLAESMISIGDNNRACIALAEFGDTYPAVAAGRLKEQYDRTKNKVRCTK